MTNTLRAIIVGYTLALAGCGNLIGPEKSLQLYVLNPPKAEAAPLQSVNWQLLVGKPQAPASLDTARIALNPTPVTMDYFANASWPDRLPLLFQSLLIEGFEKNGRVPAVARDTSGLGANYMLETEIREFQAQYANETSPPTIAIRIEAALVEMPAGKIIGHTEIGATARAETNTLPAIVNAFNQAAGTALEGVIGWTLAAAPPTPTRLSEKEK